MGEGVLRKPNEGSVFERGQRLQHFRRSWPMHHGIIFANFSIAEYQHSLRELRNVMLVRNQHDRQAFVVQILEDFHNLHRRAAVQIPRGFISQQDCRTIDQSARHGDSLLLPSGHLRWKMFHSVREADQRQRVNGAFPALGLVDLRVQRRQFCVFQRRSARQQVEPLKNKSDLLVPDLISRFRSLP